MSYLPYVDYIQSLHWCKLRDEVFARDGKRCRCCKSGHKLCGHHMVYRSPIESGIAADILTLCEPCHDHLHRGLKFNGVWLASIATPEQSIAFIVSLRTNDAYQNKYFKKQPDRKQARITWKKAKKKSSQAKSWAARMKRFREVHASIKRFQAATRVTREKGSNFGTNIEGRLIYSPKRR